MTNPFEKILKSKKYFTKDVDKQIKMYSLDKQNNSAHVIGSMAYRSGNASDVDLFEMITRDDLNDIIFFFTKNIQRIVNDLQKTKKQYFLEVKLGTDTLFRDIKIGKCENNVYNIPSELFDILNDLYTKGFIPDKEYVTIEQVQKEPVKDQLCYELIKKIIRSHSVLRWSSKEILQGYKYLIDYNGTKYKYYIQDAVMDKGQVNIEGIFINGDNKYVDCSNFFVLMYKDDKGFEHMLNLPQESFMNLAEFRKENLKQAMYTLMYSKLDPNLFKVLKRMLSYGKAFEDVDLISKIYPLINSQLGVVYNIMAQLKTCSKVLSDHGSKTLYKTSLYHTLDALRFRLQELIFIDYDFRDVSDLITLTLSDQKIKMSELSEMINIITKSLMKFLNHQTQEEMSKIGLYPLPANLLPSTIPF